MAAKIFEYVLKTVRNSDNDELTITDITGTYPTTVTGWSGYDGILTSSVQDSTLKILDLDTGDFYTWTSSGTTTLDTFPTPYEFPFTNSEITVNITDTTSTDSTWSNNLKLIQFIHTDDGGIGGIIEDFTEIMYEFYDVEQCIADLNYKIASGTGCKADNDNYSKVMSWYLGYTDAISAGAIDTAYAYSLKIYNYCNGILGGCNCGV